MKQYKLFETQFNKKHVSYKIKHAGAIGVAIARLDLLEESVNRKLEVITRVFGEIGDGISRLVELILERRDLLKLFCKILKIKCCVARDALKT